MAPESTATQIVRHLLNAKSRLIQQIVSQELRDSEKAEVRARILFLENLERELEQRVPFEKTLFISHSEGSKPWRVDIISRIARDEHEFKVRTGFDYSTTGSLLRRALTGIESSFCFLSVMTPRHAVVGQDGKQYWAPSTWVVEEKGMALALGKPFHLLVSDCILEDFWNKTTPDTKHTIFSDDNEGFEARAREALDALNTRYFDRILERVWLHR